MTPGLEAAIAECVWWLSAGFISGICLTIFVIIAQRR